MKIHQDRIIKALEKVLAVVLMVDNARELLIGKVAAAHVEELVRLIKRRQWSKIPKSFFLGFWFSQVHFIFFMLNLFARDPAATNLLKAPPGQQLSRIAEFLFSRRTNEMVFLPVISDMREEYFEALSQNRIWKARWVRVRGTWSFFAAMGLDRIFSIVSLCVKVWKSVS